MEIEIESVEQCLAKGCPKKCEQNNRMSKRPSNLRTGKALSAGSGSSKQQFSTGCTRSPCQPPMEGTGGTLGGHRAWLGGECEQGRGKG